MIRATLFTKLSRSIARLALVLSILSFGGLGLLLTQRYWPNHFPELAAPVAAVSDSRPVLLTYPQLNLALPIIPAHKEDQEWQVSPKNLSAIAPAQIDRGYIIYGHNWPKLLGPLHKAAVGDEFTITSADEQVIGYRVVGLSTIRPDQDTVLHQVPSDHVLLYTCTGFFDRSRLLLIGEEI